MQANVLSKTPIAFAPTATGLEKFFKLEHWRVKVDDREDDRIIWRRGDFVLIVAITKDAQVVLILEYKQAVEKVLLCIPAGAVKKDEKPEVAALRELRKETGFTGAEKECRVLGPFYNSPDKSTERHFVVVVTDAIRQGEATPEECETILGVQLCPLIGAKDKLEVGLHYMAVAMVTELTGQ
ncbi:MAG: hypothetical protein A2908_01695 [Candidatus Staskawiczbacteria bacterium RIFCSPLOWO2_01_FULL_38_12b]|uniref:Nudix hydrolase domain-containing protein n=1 Tax=Candidatus Staskawiczbacteria bacterium RIFCSPLOWO2_01_FULL_38_12b TaxID=1802214 RepID=A0A1G2ICW4_9BACT|nr:MAG: hypothetical protein A2908_01695 [Candidatus Staskawiczbacteria bacterium RIFCSPLOWO2_01_FULL_38_12b]